MDDCFCTIFAPVIEQYCVSQNLWLYEFRNASSHLLSTLSWFKEFSGQNLKNHICSNSFRQQIVKFGSNLAQLFRTLLRYHILCDFASVAFILWTRHVRLCSQIRVFEFDSLKHHDGPSQVSARLP